MKPQMIIRNLVLPAVLLLGCFSLSFAATVTPVALGGGKFVIQASSLSNAAGMEMTITYNAAALKNPRLEPGTLAKGALFAPNLSVQGVIRFALINATPLPESGTVVTITFDQAPGAQGNISIASMRIIDVQGATLASGGGGDATSDGGVVPVKVVPDDKGTDKNNDSKLETQDTVIPPGKQITGNIGVLGITMPGDVKEQEPPVERQTEPVQQEPPPRLEQPQSVPAQDQEQETQSESGREQVAKIKETERTFVTYPGIEDRFKAFKGEITPGKLLELFQAPVAESIVQEPAIALADGNTLITIRVKAPIKSDSAPNFALKGANLKSLKRGADGAWIVEALPEKGTHKAVITIVYDGGMIEYPLTVAPVIAPSSLPGGKFSESNFAQFLKERGKEKAPRYDLNGDGQRNFIDDYIYTANYLVATRAKAK